MIFYALIFLGSALLLFFASKWLVDALDGIAKFLGWKEFIVGFFIMAVATSFPNLFIGIISALKQVPEISFGDVVGANIFDLSLVVAIAAFLSRDGLSAQSRTVQGSALFTMAIALLPLLLVFDGTISRGDGLLLIGTFISYIVWVFSKKERFTKVYDHFDKVNGIKFFFRNAFIFTVSAIFIILAARGFVESSLYFAKALGLPLGIIGMFMVAIGTSLPESFFALQAAKKGQDYMLLGDLMGGVIIVATLVLGIVALIYPIRITDFSPFAVGRFFLIIAAMLFLLAVRSGKKVTKKEAFFLLFVYITFLIAEIMLRQIK